MPADFEAMTLDELRRRRDGVRDEEEALSYRRRLLHAQLDLVQAAGAVSSPDDFESMLAEILADEPGAAGGEIRAVAVGDLPDEDGIDPLPSDLVGLSAEERTALVVKLQGEEHAVSERRRELLDELDALQRELVARYRRDGVDARQLLRRGD